MRRLRCVALPLVLVALLAGCTGGSRADSPAVGLAPHPTGRPAASLPGAIGDGPLRAMLLQGDDLPGMTLRASVDPAVEQTSSPQLALCRAPGPALPHQVANVLAKGSRPGQAQVFEVVAVYADPAAARQAWEYDVASARACASYAVGDTTYTVAAVRELPAPAGAVAVQYRLAASDVVSGDVRTLAVQGRATVLLSSFGTPADGSELTDYQAGVAARALARLPGA